MRTRFRPDHQLTARMMVTVFLLGLVYVAFIVALVVLTKSVVVIVLIVLAVYGISFLLLRALSRYRELAADRAGAILTGRPSELAAALTKISSDIARIPSRDLRAEQPFNAFFFAPAAGAGAIMSALLSTHPSLEQRLDRLAELATELGRER
jgi:heat shock protein HtpX